jgi:hypothetical protein
LSFGRRYVDSLLSAEPHPLTEPESRRESGAAWWRRYAASLFDLPLASGLSQRAVWRADSDVASGNETPGPSEQPRNRLLRGDPQRVPAPVPVRMRRRGPNAGRRPLAPLVGMVVALSVLVGVSVMLRSSLRPSAAGEPAPTSSLVSPSPGGQIVWQGTLTFVAESGLSDRWSVVTKPTTQVFDDDATLVLCASSCRPPHITGQALVAWTGKKPPTRDQCAAQLAGTSSRGSAGFIPLRPGQSACFRTAGGIGSLTVLTAAPAVSASGTVWAP